MRRKTAELMLMCPLRKEGLEQAKLERVIERFKSVLGEHVTEARVQVIERLYENALLIEGLHPNPATMISRVQAPIEGAEAAWTE